MPGIRVPLLLPIRSGGNARLRSGLFPYAPPRASVVTPVNGVYVVAPRPTPKTMPVPPAQPQQLSAAQPIPQSQPHAVARNPWARAYTETRGFNWVGGPLPFMNIPILATRRFITWQPPLLAPQRRWWLV